MPENNEIKPVGEVQIDRDDTGGLLDFLRVNDYGSVGIDLFISFEKAEVERILSSLKDDEKAYRKDAAIYEREFLKVTLKKISNLIEKQGVAHG